MEVRLALRGDLAAYLRADAVAAAGAITTVIRRKTTVLKNRLRRQVAQAGLGTKLGNAIRSRTIPPRGTSVHTMGIVESKALVKRPGGLIDLIHFWDTGGTIRAAIAGSLLIGGRLLRKGGKRFARVEAITLPKRLDVDGAFQQTIGDIETQVLIEWDRRVERTASRFGQAA